MSGRITRNRNSLGAVCDRASFIQCLFLAAALAGCGASSGSVAGNSPEKRAQLIYKEGKKALREGDTGRALQIFRAALDYSKKQNLQEGIATALHSIALTHIQRKEWRQALTFLNRTLTVDRQILQNTKEAPENEKLRKARTRIAETKVASNLNDLARLHQRLGEPEAALNRLGELLTIDLRLSRMQGAAITHNNIGRIFMAMNNLEKARRHYLFSLALFEKIKEKKSVETVRKNLQLLEKIRQRQGAPSFQP